MQFTALFGKSMGSKKLATVKRILRSFAFGIPLLLSLALPGKADADLCFVPTRDCKTMFITEAGYSRELNDLSRWYITFDYGLMVNLDRRFALGGTFFIGIPEGIAPGFGRDIGERLGIRARARWWLSDEFSFDLSPGVLVYEGQDLPDLALIGFVGSAGVSYADVMHLFLLMEAVDRPVGLDLSGPSKIEVTWYGGVKLGHYPGIIATLALLLLQAGGDLAYD